MNVKWSTKQTNQIVADVFRSWHRSCRDYIIWWRIPDIGLHDVNMSSNILCGATRLVDISRAAATRRDVVCIIFVVAASAAAMTMANVWRPARSWTSQTLPAKHTRGFTDVLFGQASRQFGGSIRHCLRDQAWVVKLIKMHMAATELFY